MTPNCRDCGISDGIHVYKCPSEPRRHSNDREIFRASLAVLGFAIVVLAVAIAALLYWLA